MYLQEILEVAIGLVFIWLVLSIAAMTIQEWIANVLNTRANVLEKTIGEMLNSNSLARRFYNHPLITSLYRPAKKANQKGRLPSYIPPAKFASALFELVVSAGTDTSPLRKLTATIDQHLAASLENQEQLKLALEDWQTILDTGDQVVKSGLGQAAVDTLKVQIQAFGRKYPEIQPTLDEVIPQAYAFYKEFFDEERTMAPAGTEVDLGMRQFRLGLKMIGGANPRLKGGLSALLRDAQVTLLEGEQAVAAARKQFESWFNDSMDRLSGAYKRKAQFMSFLIGLVLALILNIDSINVATSLWREPTLRQAIIAEAQHYSTANLTPAASTNPDGSLQSPVETIPELQKQLQVLNLPFGWTSNPVDYLAGVGCDLSAPSAYDSQGIPSRLLGIHFGNVCVPVVNALPLSFDNIAGWATKLLGLLLTGAAAAQGAPFWFDILKKFINVRGTGLKPEDATPVG